MLMVMYILWVTFERECYLLNELLKFESHMHGDFRKRKPIIWIKYSRSDHTCMVIFKGQCIYPKDETLKNSK